jgi:radical SAM protein with 4Fe4S-binding SPASM domain
LGCGICARDEADRVSPDLDLMTRNVLLDDNHAGRWKEILLPLGWRPEFRRWINLVGGAESLASREWMPGRGVCMYVSEWPQLFVDADGTVVPCCAHPRAGNFGNLSTMKWSEIHFGKPREQFVLQMTNERSSMRTCNVCEFGADTDNSKYLVPETADA